MNTIAEHIADFLKQYPPFDNLSFEELTPRIFSFNAPYGACERCSGLGADFIVDPDLVVPDKSELAHEQYNQTHDEFYYKMYFDMLKVIFEPAQKINRPLSAGQKT